MKSNKQREARVTENNLKRIVAEELRRILEGYDPDEFATAAGMKQDLDDRAERGDFRKGDWGIEGPSWGEMKSRGEFPWIQDALSSLSDESHPERLKAVEALANELGVSVSFRPFEPLEESSASSREQIELGFEFASALKYAYRQLKENGMRGMPTDAIQSLVDIGSQILRSTGRMNEAEKEYPNNSTMKKLIGQAKMDGRYKEDDPEKLKKDYDKHVRDTRRDPKYNRKGK
tara:strand:- start:3956 stop:4651 length:696 start_codon:yes stop_codon:yes gene_type:complete